MSEICPALCRRTLIKAGFVIVAAPALLRSAPASAQKKVSIGTEQWPAKAIRVVVGAGVSTPPDIITRIVANEVSAATGWTFVVENRYGAAQTVAGMDVKRSPADGYSIWLMGMVATTAPTLMPQMALDIARDFAPVSQLARSYNVLVVNPAVQATSIRELADLIKQQPGKLTYVSGGLGTPAHLIGEVFRLTQKLDAVHVPYAQFPPAIQDLLGNRVQFGFLTTLPMVELIAAGKLRALAVTSSNRLPILRQVPTVAEAGHPGLAVDDWFGVMVVKGTPPEIVNLLNKEFNAALERPAVRTALERLGAEAVGGSPAEFGALAQNEVVRWTKLLNDAGIKIQR